ncbi:hypothetical protein EGR_04306 [Echinococcus granulosus]|uniref:Uncharacterized protein n=1 Tax=Echinococcus granulosus TaxID=6210 RepID=W6URB6_ECHGR|nr:hypothetical protein EGR_04306 [Echinococcus granulosus]EUB60867.1 hypothetical protein EGR_04306 [Echinococcus granulosus]
MRGFLVSNKIKSLMKIYKVERGNSIIVEYFSRLKYLMDLFDNNANVITEGDVVRIFINKLKGNQAHINNMTNETRIYDSKLIRFIKPIVFPRTYFEKQKIATGNQFSVHLSLIILKKISKLPNRRKGTEYAKILKVTDSSKTFINRRLCTSKVTYFTINFHTVALKRIAGQIQTHSENKVLEGLLFYYHVKQKTLIHLNK